MSESGVASGTVVVERTRGGSSPDPHRRTPSVTRTVGDRLDARPKRLQLSTGRKRHPRRFPGFSDRGTRGLISQSVPGVPWVFGGYESPSRRRRTDSSQVRDPSEEADLDPLRYDRECPPGVDPAVGRGIEAEVTSVGLTGDLKRHPLRSQVP